MAGHPPAFRRLIDLLNKDGKHDQAAAAQSAHNQAISEGLDQPDAYNGAMKASGLDADDKLYAKSPASSAMLDTTSADVSIVFCGSYDGPG